MKTILRRLHSAINESTALARFVSAINVAADLSSEWLEVKYGVYPNAVGLQVLDRPAADAMVRAFNSIPNRAADLFRGLPGYIGHPDDLDWKKQNPGVRAEAIARIKEVQAGENELRLRVALNDEGKRLVSGDAAPYDSFSPNWGMVPITHQGRKAFRPVELFSIGLTNKPNIPGTFIGLNEALPIETPKTPAMKTKTIALLAALGRPIADAANVTDEQLATAINEATPVATQLVTAANELAAVKPKLATADQSLATAQTALTAATNEAATLRTALSAERSARAEQVLVTAINEGRITAAQKAEWLGKLTATNADFAAVSTQLGALKKAINTKSHTDEIGKRRGVSAESKTRVNAINEAVTKKMKDLGTEDRQVAYMALRTEKPELFSATNAE